MPRLQREGESRHARSSRTSHSLSEVDVGLHAQGIFANFHDSDQGRGRIPIAELYSGHCGLDGAASNARLIVRAVNNHAALVEALRDLVQAADRVGDWGVDTRMSRALDKVDAALRAATEGETT